MDSSPQTVKETSDVVIEKFEDVYNILLFSRELKL